MNTTRTGAAARTVMTLLVGTLIVACQDTAGPVEPTFDEQAAATEAELDQSVASLGGLDQQMGSEVDLERERDRDRDRVRDGERDRRPAVDRVGLVVELGASAVSLADRILNEQGATEAQLRLLDAAAEFVRKAEAALAEGDAGRAVGFAEKACWTALKAVVLPHGVSEEEARMIHDLAEELLGQARAAVEAGGTPLEELVLSWAQRFFQVGSSQLGEGGVHGVAALWKSAVLSVWIVG